MIATVDLSYEFANLVKQLHASPDNPVLKQAVVSKIPEMTLLAKTNPLALYRLAQIHSPSSSQYKQMMKQSADMGCTNAMLAICENLFTAEKPSPADLKVTAHYMLMIERSNDSYILEMSKALLARHSELATLIKSEFKSDSYQTNLRFFTSQPEKISVPAIDADNKLSL